MGGCGRSSGCSSDEGHEGKGRSCPRDESHEGKGRGCPSDESHEGKGGGSSSNESHEGEGRCSSDEGHEGLKTVGSRSNELNDEKNQTMKCQDVYDDQSVQFFFCIVYV